MAFPIFGHVIRSRYIERPERDRPRKNTAHPMRIPVVGFLALIAIGTLLLWAPFSTHKPISMLDALFTATSAACVTGLSVVDTGTTFTIWGQLVLIGLMQVGGLGIMTFSTSLLLVSGMRPGFGHQIALISGFSTEDSQIGASRLLKDVLKYTFALEGIGALLLFTQFDNLPLGERAFHAVFHSVAAFCNAGFGLYANSMESYATNWVVSLTISGLIITGGIGFLVLTEVFTIRPRNKEAMKRLSLHSRLAIYTSALLVVGGTMLFLVMENNNALATYSWPHKILISLFQSVSSRTAGFNSIPIGGLCGQTLFMLIILMFIGGSPGSCAGGIRTTTAAVLGLLGFNRFWGRERTQVMSRTLPEETVEKAVRLFVISVSLIAGLVLLLLSTEMGFVSNQETGNGFLAILFETISAFGTVGLSMGITGQLTDWGKLLIILTMFIGRLGPLVLVTAVKKRDQESTWFAEEQIMVG